MDLMMISRFRNQRHSLAIVALLCALCARVWAQTPATDAATPRAGLNSGLNIGATGAVPIPLNREQLRGAPLFWASDITDAGDLPAYKSVGLNTVVVRLNWDPNTDKRNLAAVDVTAQRAFAQAAARTGLKVIYALPAVPKGMEFQIRIAGDSPSYNPLWTSWASGAIAALRDTPNLAGWMLPDDPRSLPVFTDEGFQRYIGRNYANIGVVNTQWGTQYHDLSEIRQDDVAALVERNRTSFSSDDAPALGALGTPDNPIIRNSAWHPAALALAAYRWEAYRELLATWIGAVRGADSNHLVFSGALPDYAQMLSVPAGVDVILPAAAPNVVEDDIVTYNPQSIDIARRGGKFAAMPVFSVRESGLLPAGDLPNLSKRWLQEACARGAAGIGLDSWPDLEKNLDLRQSLLEEWRDLNRAPTQNLWGNPPVATTAIILAPLADGSTLGYGPIAQGGKRGLYGWAENLVDGEPSGLVWSMRWGTAFGGVDYLAPDDLDGSLDAYNVIFAPQMLSCSLDNQTALTNYVTAGGVLVADLGLGALQSGGQSGILPKAMSLLFGVPGVYNVRPNAFNIQGAYQHPLLPKWNEKTAVRKNVGLTRGDGLGGSAFVGPTGYSLLPPAAAIIGVGPQIGTKLGNGASAIWSAPLTANDAGRGTAIFAPFRMWTNWRPGYIGFDDFHGNLMAHGATLAVNQNARGAVKEIVPSSVNTPAGITSFPEIVNRAADVTFINHDAPGQPLQLVGVETTGVGDWLWSGGIAQLPNEQNVSLVGGRPAPIDNPSALEGRLRPLRLYAAVETGAMIDMRMEPISAQNLGGGPVCGQVVSNTRAGAEVYLWPNAASVIADASASSWQPVPTVPARVRLTVYSSPGGVNWAPGTRVRAQVTSASVVKSKKGDKMTNSNSEIFAVVDARGRATWELESASARVQIAGG